MLAGLIAAIVGVAAGAGIAYGKLLMRVNQLEANPLIKAWKHIQEKQAIDSISKMLDEWREKERD